VGTIDQLSQSSAILNVTFDCHDPERIAHFWGEVLGYHIERVNSPGNEYWVVSSHDKAWPRLVFVKVPEAKVVKNRVHLDIVPSDGDQPAEVERLENLGARIVDDRRELVPGGWVVMSDPEGNEFCVE
jgi:predicted enzyme related to lactoylglutathione lyase